MKCYELNFYYEYLKCQGLFVILFITENLVPCFWLYMIFCARLFVEKGVPLKWGLWDESPQIQFGVDITHSHGKQSEIIIRSNDT